jgi:arylesterase/paraoxonase
MFKVFILLVALYSSKTVVDSGHLKEINPHFDGICKSIENIPGPEDITILDNGLAIISSDFRRKIESNDFLYSYENKDLNSLQGNIYFYDLNNYSSSPLNMTEKLNFEFHPHGISTYLNDENNLYLSVVNHTSKGDFIEIFYYDNIELKHLETISSPLLVSPNDIVLINESQFYVTNDHGFSKPFFKLFEDYLQMSKSNILFYDGSYFIEVVADLQMANGINVSRDKKIVYCAETIGQKLNIYRRNQLDNSLSLLESIEIDSGLDNIEIDLDGNLYIGSHPKLFDFIKHAKDKTHFSPSQVFKISPDYTLIEEIFLSDGNDLSASTVGAFYNNVLLIGAVFDNHFLHCELEDDAIY